MLVLVFGGLKYFVTEINQDLLGYLRNAAAKNNNNVDTVDTLKNTSKIE